LAPYCLDDDVDALLEGLEHLIRSSPSPTH
jgi:hypothetical protein